MLSKNPFILNIMNYILNKPLYFLEDGRLNVSNIIDPDYLSFFDEYYGEYYDKLFITSMIGLHVQIMKIQ